MGSYILSAVTRHGRLLSRATKIILCKTLIRLVVSYGAEAWTLTKKEEQALLIYQPTNAHKISHKALLKHSYMFRSCQIIIRELCSLLNLYYSIHNSIRICKRVVVAAYHVLCCGAVARCASYDAHLATAPQHIPTQHDMLLQHLICK